MASGRYWSDRDTFKRDEERMLRDQILTELYRNPVFSIYRCCRNHYVASDHQKINGYYRLIRADRTLLTALVNDPEQWSLFCMRAEDEGRMIELTDANRIQLSRETFSEKVSTLETELDPTFEVFLSEQNEVQKTVIEREGISGTPEWRKRIEREVTQDAFEEKKRYAALPWYRKLFIQPSVRKRMKNVQEQVIKTQNHLLYEEFEKKRQAEAGSVSPQTIRALIAAVAGIALFYAFLMLRIFNLQFIPALAGSAVAFFFLTSDQNSDTRNMNMRLIAWTATVICFFLAVIALVSMFQ